MNTLKRTHSDSGYGTPSTDTSGAGASSADAPDAGTPTAGVNSVNVSDADAILPDVVLPDAVQSAAVQSDVILRDVSLPDEALPDIIPSDVSLPDRKRRRKEVLEVVPNAGSFPRSAYEFWTPPLPPSSERSIVQDVSEGHKPPASEKHPDYALLPIDDFSIYRPNSGEMVSLERLTSGRFPVFRIDGLVTCGDRQHYLKDAWFKTLTLDGYGDHDAIHMAQQICVQTTRIAKWAPQIYFQLGRPAPEYKRFYNCFVWLARFSKHFVDYLMDAPEKSVTLAHFRQHFHQWLCAEYEEHQVINWLREAKRKDFRHIVIAHVEFLWKECSGLDDQSLLDHPLWSEVLPHNLTAIPAQKCREDARTAVTPFAKKCFSSMYFADALEVHQIADPDLAKEIKERKARLRLTPNTFSCGDAAPEQSSEAEVDRSAAIQRNARIRKGDVIAVQPDTDGQWKSSAPVWYAYVQGVRESPKGIQYDILWLYHSSDTALSTATYPFPKELFMSDNCGCDKNAQKDAIEAERVLGKVHVTWHPADPAAETGLFVRQTYRTRDDTHDFVYLQDSHLECECGRGKESMIDAFARVYEINETVLYQPFPDSDLLEPAQIISIHQNFSQVRLRNFHRVSKLDATAEARPNELVPDTDTFYISPSAIDRKCQVRTFDDINGVVTPYDRDGTGELFYVLRSRLSDHAALPPWQEGWDPNAETSMPKMKGLGLFCGGGTFDRGLEEGGAVHFTHAVDWDTQALHTYRANAKEDVCLFHGSVNDSFLRALQGGDELVARPGTVNVVAGGCPCVAFSKMQLFHNSESSIRNASLVASMVAYADLYAPEYLILENVVTMANGFGPGKTQRILQQVMAALIALGYQTQALLMDAWCHGSSQGRVRVFIIASAPGRPPFVPPPRSHAHPGSWPRALALGKLSNGLFFGERLTGPTPFPMCTAASSVADLPPILDGLVSICPQFPDHRMSTYPKAYLVRNCDAIPRFPRGVGMKYAHTHGLLRGSTLDFYNSGNAMRKAAASKAYSRIDPNGLFPTILTVPQARDAIAGRVLHWYEPRMFSVMEARRAQGYPEDEVIVGLPHHQMHIIGNGVDRKVALVLGRCLYESWMAEQAQ